MSRRPYDAAATRAAILTAATAAFAEAGFAGARIDAIAAEAGCNKSLIFQYFGDKLALYATVIQQINHEAAALQAQIGAPLQRDPMLSADLEQLRSHLETSFTAIIEHLEARPQVLQILLWEMADQWRTYRQVAANPVAPDPAFAALQTHGLLRSELPLPLQLSHALQSCQTLLACRPLYTHLVGDATPWPTIRRAMVSAIVAGLLVDRAPNNPS